MDQNISGDERNNKNGSRSNLLVLSRIAIDVIFHLQVLIEHRLPLWRRLQRVERRQQHFLVRGLESALPRTTLGECRAPLSHRGQRKRDGVEHPAQRPLAVPANQVSGWPCRNAKVCKSGRDIPPYVLRSLTL